MMSIDARSLQSQYTTGIERMTRRLIEYWPQSAEPLSVLLSQDVDVQPGNYTKRITRLPGFLWYRGYLPARFVGKGELYFISPTTLFPPGLPRNVVRVAVVHDLAYHYFPELYPKSELQVLLSKTDTAIASADIVMAVSEVTKKDCVKFLGIDPARIHVAHLATDVPLPVGQGIPTERMAKPFILTVGTAYGRKNLKILPDIAYILRSQHNIDVNVVMTGKKGFAEEWVMHRAKELGVENNIIHLGFVSDQQKADLFRSAQAFIFPSVYEGFGIPLLEAMSYGCPVLCSDIEVMHEVAGDAALFVNPQDPQSFANCYMKLSSDDGVRREYIQKGDLRWKQFSWDRMAATYFEVITEYAHNRN